MPQVHALTGYWNKYPPIHRLACAYFGITGDEPKKYASREETQKFLKQLEVKR